MVVRRDTLMELISKKPLLLVFLPNQPGDLEFARDLRLAKTASRHFDAIFLGLCFLHNGVGVLLAFVLIMAFDSDRSCGTPGCAHSAGPVKEVKTIGMDVRREPFRRSQRQFCYNTSKSHGLASGRDQPVTETEGSQAAGISHMAFRPT